VQDYQLMAYIYARTSTFEIRAGFLYLTDGINNYVPFVITLYTKINQIKALMKKLFLNKYFRRNTYKI